MSSSWRRLAGGGTAPFTPLPFLLPSRPLSYYQARFNATRQSVVTLSSPFWTSPSPSRSAWAETIVSRETREEGEGLGEGREGGEGGERELARMTVGEERRPRLLFPHPLLPTFLPAPRLCPRRLFLSTSIEHTSVRSSVSIFACILVYCATTDWFCVFY